MQWHGTAATALVASIAALASDASQAQVRRFVTPPDQVIADVQAALQQMGYYQGEVDGLLGPMTREALNCAQ